MPEELTVDKCVLLHCDSRGYGAERYCENGKAFIRYWSSNQSLFACLNSGIDREYMQLSETGQTWLAGVMIENRYARKKRCIFHPQRIDFQKKMKVPLHGEDFDYVDAASQSNTHLWLSNETNWQNTQYRWRIQVAFQVGIQNVNEYMNCVGNKGIVVAS